MTSDHDPAADEALAAYSQAPTWLEKREALHSEKSPAFQGGQAVQLIGQPRQPMTVHDIADAVVNMGATSAQRTNIDTDHWYHCLWLDRAGHVQLEWFPDYMLERAKTER